VTGTTCEARPFLRWAGSKRQLLPKLRTYWGTGFKRYIEPFMGSACLFFAVRPKSALLSDLNKDLVETFRQVRNNPDAVASRLQSYRVSKASYYKLRAVQPDSLGPLEAASRFIYLNRFCFNGLFRTNGKGHFNVPIGSSGTGSLPSEALLKQCASLLKHAELRCYDFSDTLGEMKRGDFAYLDPPFAVKNRRVFREYNANAFGPADLARLAHMLKCIDSLGAFFVVSYADSREGRDILHHWNMSRVRTRRNIAGFTKHRRHAFELVATNIDNRPHGQEFRQ
jgi:DNA adenine methylase